MAQRVKYHRTARGGYYANQPSPDYWRQRSKERLSETMANLEAVDSYEVSLWRNAYNQFLAEYQELVKPYLTVVDGETVIDAVALKLAMENSPKFAARLARVDAMINQLSKVCGKSAEANLTSLLSWTYENGVRQVFLDYGIENPPLALINKKAVKAAIHTPWTSDGREFSDRIWTNMDTMSENLRDVVSNTLLKGTSLDTASRQFNQIFNSGYSNCRRILRTETCACLTKSSLAAYKELHVRKVEILGVNGDCDSCSPYEGKILPIGKVKVGIELPPYHPNCKCCIAPVVNL